MLTYLSKKISFFLFCKKIITCDEIEIYQYGFETILSTILGFLITIIIGCVLNMTLISILYYAVFVLLRQLTGGYHANTYFKEKYINKFKWISCPIQLIYKFIYTKG